MDKLIHKLVTMARKYKAPHCSLGVMVWGDAISVDHINMDDASQDLTIKVDLKESNAVEQLHDAINEVKKLMGNK